MRPRVSTFSLGLPISLKAAAEKLASIQTAEAYFAGFRGRGDVDRALSFLSRSGGETPRAGDETEIE